MTYEEEIARSVESWSEAELRAFADEFAQALAIELICGDGMPAEYRRALLRHELATMSDAAAEEYFERVMGRLDYDDELVVLMAGG